MLRVTIKSILFLLCLTAITPAVARAQPRVSIAPTQYFGDPGRPDSFRDGCLNVNQWPYVLSQINYYSTGDGNVWDMSIPDKTQCFANLNAANVGLNLGVSVLKPGRTNGEVSFEISFPSWDSFRNLGARIRAFEMDDPLSGGTEGGLTREQAAVEVCSYIRRVRQEFPEAIIVDVESYPSWNGAELQWWIGELRSRCSAIGTVAPDYLILDDDRNGLGRSMAEVAGIAATAHAYGQGFGALFWPGGGVSQTDDRSNSSGGVSSAQQ